MFFDCRLSLLLIKKSYLVNNNKHLLINDCILTNNNTFL